MHFLGVRGSRTVYVGSTQASAMCSFFSFWTAVKLCHTGRVCITLWIHKQHLLVIAFFIGFDVFCLSSNCLHRSFGLFTFFGSLSQWGYFKCGNRSERTVNIAVSTFPWGVDCRWCKTIKLPVSTWTFNKKSRTCVSCRNWSVPCWVIYLWGVQCVFLCIGTLDPGTDHLVVFVTGQLTHEFYQVCVG